MISAPNETRFFSSSSSSLALYACAISFCRAAFSAALVVDVGFQRVALGFQLRGEAVGVALVIVTGDKFVLAAGEKLHEIGEKLAGLGEAAEFFQLEPYHVAAQQDPVIDFVEHDELRIDFLQQRFAERVEGDQRHVFAALAGGLHDPRLHFAGGFFRVGESENVFAGKRWIDGQQVADALDDHACFACAGAGDDQQRTFAVDNGTALRFVQLERVVWRRLQIKQRANEG